MRSEQVKLQSALKDIDQHVSDALEVIGELTVVQFCADHEKVAAVGFHGIIIGEAASRALSAGHHIDEPELVSHLQRARLARNEFVHEYDVLEPDNLYVTVTNVYVPLQRSVREYLGLPT